MTPNDFLLFLSCATLENDANNFEKHKEATLVHLIKSGNEGVRTCFFASESTACGLDQTSLDKFSELAVKYVCYGIANVTDHDFNNTVQNCTYPVVGDWFKANAALGAKIFDLYLSDNLSGLNNETFKNDLSATLMSTSFIMGQWIVSVNQSPKSSKLVCAAAKLLLPEHYDAIMAVWARYLPTETIAQITDCDWFAKYETLDTLYEYYFKDSVREAVLKKSNESHRTEAGRSVWSGTSIYGNWETIEHQEWDVGTAVLTWLNNGDAAKYGLRSNVTPNNHIHQQTSEWHSNAGLGGCVSPGTAICMADGSMKPIQSLREGDCVRSEGNAVSVCSGELIHNRSITELYGINARTPFLSFEHALMTQRGWCCLNPALANEINPHFEVKQLEVGDFVTILLLDCDGNRSTAQEKVERITVALAPPEEPFEGYDLHFREGRQSYYADGLLCLLNYPELTAKRVRDNLCGMTEAEKSALAALFAQNLDLLSKAFGHSTINHYIQEVQHAKLQSDDHPTHETAL